MHFKQGDKSQDKDLLTVNSSFSTFLSFISFSLEMAIYSLFGELKSSQT